MQQNQDQDFIELMQTLADIAGVPVDTIKPSARIIGDLGLDSLGIMDLTAFLVEKSEAPPARWSNADWERLTVAEIMDTYRFGAR